MGHPMSFKRRFERLETYYKANFMSVSQFLSFVTALELAILRTVPLERATPLLAEIDRILKAGGIRRNDVHH
jgi:hypothetical protein